MPVGRAARRLRRRAGARDRYERFQARVEPELLAHPRRHRFAAVPERLDGVESVPVAVCVDVSDDGDVARTRASLERQTVRPAAVDEADGPAALTVGRAERLAIVRSGDVLAPTALETLGRAGGPGLVTCDEDSLDRRGRRVDPVCRPGPSPDFMLARDLTGSLIVVSREAALAAMPGETGAWRYELALSLAGPDGAGHAHVPAILCHRAGAPPRGDDRAELTAADRALRAWGQAGARVEAVGPGQRRVLRPAAGEPSVEAIVCFRDRPDLLRRCADSLLTRTAYERLSLRLVDNGSADPDVAALLGGLEEDPRVTVDRDPGAFNFSALNNAAAARSDADFLVFLNNDVEVTSETWVEELLGEARREEVGAVAPLLLYGDGRVQHAGAAIGIHGYAGHPFAGLRPAERTPFGSAMEGTRNWLAVSAACMMVARRRFGAVGGFDESFTVAGGDVDLCLRLTAAGHRSLCLPHVRLRHDESASRDPLDLPPGDYERSRERYGEYRTVGDPFYNPNLTLDDTTCQVRVPG
jgi:O-antigen biosynthesis protein